MDAYRAFLAVPGVKRVLIAAVFGRMPTGMLPLAVLLLMTATGNTLRTAGLAVGGCALASAAAAPVQGALATAVGTTRVLAIAAVGHSATLIALVIAANSGAASAWLVLLAACAGALMPPLMAHARGLWGVLAPDARTREAAFALDSAGIEVAWILGPVLVVACVEIASAAATMVLCAVITTVGVLGFATSSAVRGAGRGAASAPGFTLVPGRSVHRLLGSAAFFGLYWGSLQVGLPALAIEGHAEWAAGVMLALVSIGSIGSAIVYGGRTWRASVTTRYLVLLLLLALATAPLIVVHALAGVVLICLGAGAAMGPAYSTLNSLMAAAAPPGLVTQTFTWSTSAAFTGMAVGSSAAGFVVDHAGAGAPFAVAVAAAGLGAAVIWTAHRAGPEASGAPT
jgi:MFS family permease